MAYLRASVVLASIAFLVHAGFTQWYETGVSRLTSPLFALGFAACFAAFLLRKRWSWRVVGWISVVTIGINLAFWPDARHYGETVAFARILIAVEVLLSVVILGIMALPATKKQFHDEAAG